MRQRPTAFIVFATVLLLALAGLLAAPSAGAATGDGSPSDPNIAFYGR